MKTIIAVIVFALALQHNAVTAQSLHKMLLGKWKKIPAKTEFLRYADKGLKDTVNEILYFTKKDVFFSDITPKGSLHVSKDSTDNNYFKYTLKDSSITYYNEKSSPHTLFPQFTIKKLTANELTMVRWGIDVDEQGHGSWVSYCVAYFKRE